MPLACHLLVRLAHGDRVDHPGEIAERVANRSRVAPEHADRQAVGAGQLDGLEPALTHVSDDIRDLFGVACTFMSTNIA